MLSAILFNVAAFIVVLSFIVFIHEFGHYIVAKLCGVKILEFSIGFGPEFIGFNDRSGTRWKISAYPLGGYVKMFGDSDPVSTPNVMQITEENKKITFYHQALWKRFAIVAAGPIANILLTVVIMSVFFFNYGVQTNTSLIDVVVKNSPAEIAGIHKGDVITNIDGENVSTYADVNRIVGISTGKSMVITVNRGGKLIAIIVKPDMVMKKDFFGNDAKMPTIGISSSNTTFANVSLLGAVSKSFTETKNITVSTGKAVGQMIHGERSVKEMSGPIGIAKYSGQSAKMGINAVFWFIAMISINLGLMNLMPIPGLDGGHLMLYTVEAVTRRPLSIQVQTIVTKIGIGMILALGAFAIVNDIIKLF